MLANTSNKYGLITKFLHWIIAIMVITQFTGIYFKEYCLEEKSTLGRFIIVNLHKPFGVLLLGLTILLLIWRHLSKKPSYPKTMPAWEKLAAKLVRFAIFICLITMSTSGMLMSMAGGYPISIFGLYELPMLLNKNPDLGRTLHGVHNITSYIFLGLISTHILAALKHHFISKDNILKRML